MSNSAYTITGLSELGKPPLIYPVGISQPPMTDTPGTLLLNSNPCCDGTQTFWKLLPSAEALHRPPAPVGLKGGTVGFLNPWLH